MESEVQKDVIINELKNELAAKNRELEIEAALEKIRARTMAMHRSEELEEVAAILFEQLEDLNISIDGGAGIFIFPENSKDCVLWVASPHMSKPSRVNLPYDEAMFADNPVAKDMWAAKEQKQLIFNKTYPFKEKNRYFEYVYAHNDFDQIPRQVREFVLNAESHTSTIAFQKHAAIGANSYTGQLFSENDLDIFVKMAHVFEQAYIRFLDLQKAEVQAREVQIQLALERVRARTMAMQKSDELNDVAALLFQQVKELGIKTWTTGFNVWSDDNNFYTDYITTPQGNVVRSYTIDANKFSVFTDVSDAKKRGEKFWVQYLEGDLLKETYKQLTTFNNEEQFEKILQDSFQFPSHQYDHFVFGARVSLMFITYEAVPEVHDIFIRLGNVFEQTYTRFLDLQKAEAQAREAQIEAALEKIRSSSLAMHHSSEINNVVDVLYEKLKELDLAFDGGAAIILFSQGSKDAVIGVLSPELGTSAFHDLPYDKEAFVDNPIALDVWKAKDDGVDIINKCYPFEQKNRYFEYVFKHNDESKLPKPVREFILNVKSYTATFIAEKNSLLGVNSWTEQLLSEENIAVLRRVARVFEQAYIRFLDLQKAEAQAREAQIEAALERVRARAMAMHVSEELKDVVKELRKQIGLLDQKELDTCVIQLYDESPDYIHAWASMKPSVNSEEIREFYRTIPKKGLLIQEEALQAYSSGQKDYILLNEKRKLKQWMDFIKETYPDIYAVAMEGTSESEYEKITSYWSFSDFNGGSLLLVTLAPPADISRILLRRFANVFGLAYQRFADLKQAEAQAKEAKIEAALERVRGKTMAMHNSADVGSTALTMFDELKKLETDNKIRCGILIVNDDTKHMEVWTASSTTNEEVKLLIGKIDMMIHPLLEGAYRAWKNNEASYMYELRGDEVEKYYHALASSSEYAFKYSPDALPVKEICNAFFFPEGAVFAFSHEPLSAESSQVFKRFAGVFSLTYRRFRDLQKAEANAKEAVKQASIDRVRAEIASMRTTKDLERIIPLIWNELIVLNVPFIRCGVYIMNEEEQQTYVYLSTPDGKAIASFHLPYNDTGFIEKVLHHWHSKKIFIDHWDAATFLKWTKSLVEQGAILSDEKYITNKPPDNLYLHFIPFMQGMLYVGSTAPLADDEIQVVQSLAKAFSTAYARYEDFNKLEIAKQQIEKALAELRSAQALLIQKEKMASLGELTAGIAHEIQNPLNFVNNFSEVNVELIEELKSEILKVKSKNGELEGEILNDIQQNLEKILYHGKRADSIVKGMLQHSRISTGTKELTDINALVDEYLQLSYHGMRAKDKSFNVELKTEFDPSIPKINVVPQDIGRVLLNLFNNAFYAMNERCKTEGERYNAVVSVCTNKVDSKVEIHIKDNGAGMPQKVIDKIFQPFFTTKPTGQGTGLGLSMSYDIIKAHGGEIKVESKESEGSEFIIQLPSV